MPLGAPFPFLLPPLRLALSSSPASYRQNMAAAESRDVTIPAVAVATRVTATKGGRRYLGAPRVAYINSRAARGAENTARRKLRR